MQVWEDDFYCACAHVCARVCVCVASLMSLSCVIAYQKFRADPLSSVFPLVFFERSFNFFTSSLIPLSSVCLCFSPPPLHHRLPFFLSHPPTPTWILLSAHTCGFCQFIIVKSDLTGSQRAGPQPHSNIFQPAALGRALERPLSSCLLFGGRGSRGCCEQCERVHVVPVRLLRGLLKDASVMRNKWFWKGGRRRRQPGWSAVSHPSHRRSLSDAQGRDCRGGGGYE